ncbi:phage regulatory protein rha (phage prha) [Trichococcus palustris]|jgi:Rha family phage regulatory protein|uniref:Phage regulatory protein rha (Phage prha) n=1 Tax=Trichococcus palustris TaxID=140314 RepID=A0A143YCK6_9LACT|nr:phage regulatory protein/antirepressor Ant [Trichococcus palustris]CZQ83613.1 phage regulatory protein rha (phage prha) [Trichococcus palustris]SFK70215.1 phage regulatory protein, rha family [Trichococcus palustris]
MNNLQILNRSAAIDSREVSTMVEKRHTELLRDIRTYINYLAESKIASGDFFIESTYTDANNQERPCFLLTKQGCEMVANKLTGKKGVLFTARYVKKFNEMESIQPKNSYMIEDPIARAQAWIEEQREKQKLLETTEVQAQLIAEYEPKIGYLDKILQSKGLLTVTQIAADYGLSARELNKVLHEERVQHKVGNQWILYKNHMNNGYTKSNTINIVRSNGEPDTQMQTKWTQKGRLFIHELLERRGIIALMDLEMEG